MSETKSSDPFEPRRLKATALGMIRRPDVGPSAWEMPCGCVYGHFNTDEPVYLIVGTPGPGALCPNTGHVLLPLRNP